jgi:signal transduction histidine kinase
MTPLRVLIAEDCVDDYLLIEAELRAAGFELQSVRLETAEDMTRSLERSDWDIVLSDYTMPQFTAREAFRLLQASRQPDVPFVIVSGSIGEERAVQALKDGIANYVMKSNLPYLVQVVERELKDRKTRRERAQAIEALTEAVRVRDEFLSIASHELKTPLTALLLQAEGMLTAARRAAGAPLESARVLDRLESIVRSSARLNQLIERLLDITRVTTGRLELTLDDLDIAALTRDLVRRLEEVFCNAGIQVSVHGPSALCGRWDRERIDIALTNLLTNAAKYGNAKPVSVEIEDAGAIARVRVSDGGIGIAPDDQQRIFERFERAVPERHYGGFGVGLWLSREIVEAHGGTIEVQSKPAIGSTFTVTLPKRRPSA